MVGLPNNRISPKDPIANLPYAFEWAAELAPSATLVTATITVPTGITLSQVGVIEGTQVVFWLSGGTTGVAYEIACVITDSTGATNRKWFLLQVT
jgi:hypothetical protein